MPHGDYLQILLVILFSTFNKPTGHARVIKQIHGLWTVNVPYMFASSDLGICICENFSPLIHISLPYCEIESYSQKNLTVSFQQKYYTYFKLQCDDTIVTPWNECRISNCTQMSSWQWKPIQHIAVILEDKNINKTDPWFLVRKLQHCKECASRLQQ